MWAVGHVTGQSSAVAALAARRTIREPLTLTAVQRSGESQLLAARLVGD